jgi:hypothetical protein
MTADALPTDITTLANDAQASAARTISYTSAPERSRRLDYLRQRACFYRTVHLMRTVLGIDPTDPDDRDIVGDEWGNNGRDGSIIGMSTPTGPLYFTESQGRLIAQSCEDAGGAQRELVVRQLADLAPFLLRYPPYGWHASDADPRVEHLGSFVDCPTCDD